MIPASSTVISKSVDGRLFVKKNILKTLEKSLRKAEVGVDLTSLFIFDWSTLFYFIVSVFTYISTFQYSAANANKH